MITNTTVAASGTTIVQAPSGMQYAVVSVWFCNTDSASAVDINVYLVPNGSSIGTNTQIIKKLTVEAEDTFRLDSANDKIILGELDSVSATASIDGVVTATPVFLEI